jgi:hypothetical protein
MSMETQDYEYSRKTGSCDEGDELVDPALRRPQSRKTIFD